ncbi:hypothetical protein [Virgibacillus sp. SK37]|uniref:hypothetical protein n=1 Tax=Virgibacillus sp. SK37 TaxID=403957 RepID=UPI0004D194EA|nr:hypothetical protein [Virgibacillus sp. SK37]AIF45666.1 hypothetical protein X953_18935 [Virgibacillus sp. SK37]
MFLLEKHVTDKQLSPSFYIKTTRIAVLNIYVIRVYKDGNIFHEIRGKSIKKVYERLENDLGITQY